MLNCLPYGGVIQQSRRLAPRMPTFDALLYDVSEAGVATIALNQPDTRNALSDELLGELIASLRGSAAMTRPSTAWC